MYKKALCVFFALILATVIFDTQYAQATVNFPNTSISATDTFSLNLDGNGELVTIMRYQNLDNDFEWNSSTTLEIPIRITSYSEEKPNFTIKVGESVHFNYPIRNYSLSHQNDSTYNHEYVIELSEQEGWHSTILKNAVITIRITTKINGLSSNVENYSKFIFYPLEITNKKFKSHIIRVNLPNDPYYWDEILDTYPTYNYRTSFGNGESVEWRYDENSNIQSPILIDYRIHPDLIKQDLDNATMNSLYLGRLALIIAIISIPSVFWSSRDFIKWLKKK